MSWKFGGIYIKPGFENPEDALNFLQIRKRFTYETIRFSDVVNTSFGATAIGTVNGVTLVHDNLLPYNNSYEADTYTDADFKMMELSNRAEIISFFLDGITQSYGFNHFKSGQRIKRYTVMGGEFILKEGDFSEVNATQEEANIMKWLKEFTGLKFEDLLINTALKMYCFTETGF
jgi:hypothetical protein